MSGLLNRDIEYHCGDLKMNGYLSVSTEGQAKRPGSISGAIAGSSPIRRI
jgi:hypothetical protein